MSWTATNGIDRLRGRLAAAYDEPLSPVSDPAQRILSSEPDQSAQNRRRAGFGTGVQLDDRLSGSGAQAIGAARRQAALQTDEIDETGAQDLWLRQREIERRLAY